MTPTPALRRALLAVLTVALGLLGSVVPAHASPTVEQAQRLARLEALVPEGFADRLEAAASAHLINPDDYVCGPATLDAWEDELKRTTWSEQDVAFVGRMAVDSLAALDVVFADDPADPFYDLTVDAARVGRTLDLGVRFWEPAPVEVELYGIHSEAVLAPARVARVYRAYGMDEATASEVGALVASYVAASPGLQHGHSPLLSTGAFAGHPSVYPNHSGSFFAIGDGLLAAYAELGLGDVAGRAIAGHEFAHLVQIEAGVFAQGQPTTPEETRYVELQSDAMSAYLLAHPQGWSMQAKRVEAFAQTAYSTGDCLFDSAGHHGTPNQRAAASRWGAALAASTRPKARVLSYAEFDAAFRAALPSLVAPDAVR